MDIDFLFLGGNELVCAFSREICKYGVWIFGFMLRADHPFCGFLFCLHMWADCRKTGKKDFGVPGICHYGCADWVNNRRLCDLGYLYGERVVHGAGWNIFIGICYAGCFAFFGVGLYFVGAAKITGKDENSGGKEVVEWQEI